MPEPIVFAYDSELVPFVPVSPNIGKVTVVGAISHLLGAEEIDRAERDDRRDAIRAFSDADANRLTGWSQTFIHRDHARPDPTLCGKLISDGVAPGVFVDVFRSADYTSETARYTRIFRSTRVGAGTSHLTTAVASTKPCSCGTTTRSGVTCLGSATMILRPSSTT